MKSAITISIDKGLLRACRSTAYAARRTLSAQIEQWIDEKLALAAARPSPVPPAAAASRHTTPSTPSSLRRPSDLASPAAALPSRQRKEAAA